ncbi:TD and POZ domain-containing protein 1 [Trichonephila clavata]|uniref:TD and POZ domain-containing protein 1 n=1 Tax=Trichonephila clavata TaxID=2740835 RepID=A0A8X6KGC3_TRICU|nr:TD and POZ domain-containing protein 1 [Trichonephila clavata]
MCTSEYKNCEYVFNWEIENFSFCWQKKCEEFYSPVFSAESIENTSWRLHLTPKREDGYVSYYLYRLSKETGPPEIEIYCDLIFLNANKSVLREECNFKSICPKGTLFGFHEFIAKNDLILPHDTLTVRCKLRSCEKTTNVVEQFARTVIRVDQKSVDWNISEFRKIKPDEKKSISIKLTSAEDLLSLDLFLSVGEYTEKIVLVSISSSLKSIKFVTVKLLLKDTEGNTVECGQKEFYSSEVKNFKFIPLTFVRNKLLRKTDLYLKDDQLSLCCVCSFTKGIAYHGVERIICGNFPNRDENTTILSDIVTEEKNTGCVKDVKSLYNDLALSDMTLCTETKSYPAHIAILCARSPVFKAMFSSDMKESIRRKVDILDLNDDTVQRMLLYMYTDTLENLQWESALSLYKAADKYNIVSLRNQCVSFIESHLSPINVCEALELADRHQDEDFKSILQNYIVNNQGEVLDLKEWKLFVKSNSELAAESLLKICMED